MGDLGFWALAHEITEHLALVAPDGTESPRGSCWAGPTRSSTDYAASTSSPVTSSPPSSPTASRCSSCTSPAMQAGWYLVPINHHLIGERGGLHPPGLRRQGLRGPRTVHRCGPRRRRGGPTALIDLFRGGQPPLLRLLRPDAGRRRPRHRTFSTTTRGMGPDGRSRLLGTGARGSRAPGAGGAGRDRVPRRRAVRPGQPGRPRPAGHQPPARRRGGHTPAQRRRDVRAVPGRACRPGGTWCPSTTT